MRKLSEGYHQFFKRSSAMYLGILDGTKLIFTLAAGSVHPSFGKTGSRSSGGRNFYNGTDAEAPASEIFPLC
jgi:hypothetical protein